MSKNPDVADKQVRMEVGGMVALADPDRINRAVEILKSIANMLIGRGYKQKRFEEFWRRGNRFEIHGMYSEFNVVERNMRIRDTAGKLVDPPVFKNTSILELKMVSNCYRDSWHDRKRKPLEMQLNNIVAEIEKEAIRFENVQRELEEMARNRTGAEIQRQQHETDIDCVVRLWPAIPESMKRGIVAMVRAAVQSGDTDS